MLRDAYTSCIILVLLRCVSATMFKYDDSLMDKIYCSLNNVINSKLGINPLKTKRVCFIQGLSAYRAVNTLHFGYKNQSLNVL
jgi:hypothetical protein